jgi:RNA polymerase primary sigma factor
MNYLKFRANALRARLNPDDPDEAALAQVEHLLASAALLRDQILQANMRLAVSVVKKFVTPQYSFDELLSDGICSLMQAVDKFDFHRGYRFSTYAYRAISRNAYREVMNRQRQQRRYVTGSDEVLHATLDQRVGSGLDERTWQRLRGNLQELLGRLDRREQFIIAGRYALGAHRRPRTFQELADRLGVSKERARQLEQRAVSRLRRMAADTAREAPLNAARD